MFFRKRKPVGNDNAPGPQEPTIVGPDAVFDGTFTSDGDVHVLGTMRGAVSARLCVVEAQGTMEGQISAEEILVIGRVVGPLRGRHVHLQAGSSVEGDIASETIAIDHGAKLSGAVWQNKNDTSAVQVLSHEPAHRLFTENLWEPKDDDDGVRPLKAVRPPR